MAHLCAMFANVHSAKGSARRKPQDFLPYLNPWPSPGRYSELDMEVMEALGK